MKFISGPLLLGLSLAFVLNAHALDWYRWRGPDLNGISKETGWQTNWPAEGPKQLWKASVGTGFASFSVANGRVYTTGNATNTDTVFCFDAATGKVIWTYSYPSKLGNKYYEGVTSATPTVDGDHVYQFGKWGDLSCLDAAKGTVIWSTNVATEFGLMLSQWGFASSPLIEGNMLILNAGTAGLALDKNTGEALWTTGTEPAGYSTPQPYGEGDNRSLALFGSNVAYSVRLKDGKQLWSLPWKCDAGLGIAQPIIDGDCVYLSTGYNVGAALLKITDNKPEVVWKNKNMRNQINSCILWQGYLYGPDGGPDTGKLRCIAYDTGELKWSEPSTGKCSLMMVDGKLLIMSEKGELIVADSSPDAFKPIARAQILTGKCWTTPILSNGRIYCRNCPGDVVCLDVSGK